MRKVVTRLLLSGSLQSHLTIDAHFGLAIEAITRDSEDRIGLLDDNIPVRTDGWSYIRIFHQQENTAGRQCGKEHDLWFWTLVAPMGFQTAAAQDIADT